MDKRKRTKGQTKIYKTLHRKLKIEQHESHLSSGMNLGTPEGKDVPAPHVAHMSAGIIVMHINMSLQDAIRK
jgi:hypothetical protein